MHPSTRAAHGLGTGTCAGQKNLTSRMRWSWRPAEFPYPQGSNVLCCLFEKPPSSRLGSLMIMPSSMSVIGQGKKQCSLILTSTFACKTHSKLRPQNHLKTRNAISFLPCKGAKHSFSHQNGICNHKYLYKNNGT